jgi:uncharacterized protein YecE (DUF72 family)
MGKILVGTGSWSDAPLIASKRFYPGGLDTPETRLRFYAGKFDMVELDSSFYTIPPLATAASWLERTPSGFIFDVKAFRLFSLHPTPLLALPRGVRAELPDEVSNKVNLYFRDIPSEIRKVLWTRFKGVLSLLKKGGKIGVCFFQFPPWFLPGSESEAHIVSCREELKEFDVAVEFRNGAWLSKDNADRTAKLLRDNNIAYVCVDEPQGLKTSVPPVELVTSDIAVVRFHGRNAEAWEKQPDAPATVRSHYLYSEEEIREWLPRLKRLSAQKREVHVTFNNKGKDYAVVNALQLKGMLEN